MRKSILVTGASGTLGCQIIKELSLYPVHIRAALHHRPMPEMPEIFNDHIDYVSFAYDQPETYANALEGIESVLLIPPTIDASQDLVLPFLSYLAQYKGPVNHIVAVSFMGTLPSNNSSYGDIEAHLQAISLPYTILRPNWFMQNFHQHYGTAIRQHRLIALPAGSAYTSFVDVRDVAAVAAKILAEETYQWEVLTLTGWEALSYRQTAETLSQELGFTIAYQPLRDDAMRQALQQQQWLPTNIDAMLDLFRCVRDGHHAALSQDVKKVLGRPPRTFKDYVTDYNYAWASTQ